MFLCSECWLVWWGPPEGANKHTHTWALQGYSKLAWVRLINLKPVFIYICHAVFDSIIFGCAIKPVEYYIEANVADEKENPAEIPAYVLKVTLGGFWSVGHWWKCLSEALVILLYGLPFPGVSITILNWQRLPNLHYSIFILVTACLSENISPFSQHISYLKSFKSIEYIFNMESASRSFIDEVAHW